jgi:hypothetical protein
LVKVLVGGIGDGAEVTLIPSAAFIPGYPDGGGRHLMSANMRLLFLIEDMVTPAMVPITRPISLTDSGNL